MFIFYDFETSSRELLGQVLTYSFFLVSKEYDILDELSGQVRLNRTQIPEIEAILTNRINIDHLQANGQAEYEAAADIFHFLDRIIKKYGSASLVGYNSNQFDLGFLRNLCISYGLNPYFSGKLHNLDLLHYAQSVAFHSPDMFPWVNTETETSSYYSFKLEDLSHGFGLLDGAQTHDARDDVLLTIRLAQVFEQLATEPLHAFQAVSFPSTKDSQLSLQIYQYKTRHYASPGETPEKWSVNTVTPLCKVGKATLMVQLDKLKVAFEETASPSVETLTSCLRYINPNKHFFQCEAIPHTDYEHWAPIAEKVADNRFFKLLLENPSHYFELIKKEWDIAYQIHELGFDRIDTLKMHVSELIKNPGSYPDTLKRLLETRKNQKDNYLLQLYNRAYLNTHPNPDPNYLKRYMEPRYILGSLQKDPETFEAFPDMKARLDTLLSSDTVQEQDLEILKALQRYYNNVPL